MIFQEAEYFIGMKSIGSPLGGIGIGYGLLFFLRALVHKYQLWDIGLGFTLRHHYRRV